MALRWWLNSTRPQPSQPTRRLCAPTTPQWGEVKGSRVFTKEALWVGATARLRTVRGWRRRSIPRRSALSGAVSGESNTHEAGLTRPAASMESAMLTPRQRRHAIRRCAIEAHRFAWRQYRLQSGSFAIYDDLCGACTITAAYTLKLLLACGIEDARFVVGNGHAYVRCGNILVDSTGQQFGFPRVQVYEGRTPPCARGRHIYVDRLEAKTPEEAVRVMEDDGWRGDAQKVYETVVCPQHSHRRVA